MNDNFNNIEKEKYFFDILRDKFDQWFLPCLAWSIMALIAIPWIVGTTVIIKWAF